MVARQLLWTFSALGLVIFCGACLLTEVVPESILDPTIEITDPASGDVLPPQSNHPIRATAKAPQDETCELRITVNDSVFHQSSFTSFHDFAREFYPGQWTERNTNATIKAVVTDPDGFAVVDSVTISVGDYYETPPVLMEPVDGLVVLSTLNQSTVLRVADYDDSLRFDETYQFSIARDSLFTDEEVTESRQTSFTFQVQAAGSYFWRVRVAGVNGMTSPWSQTRRWTNYDSGVYSTDYLNFQTIYKVIRGQDGIYLLGWTGTDFVVMKRGLDLSPRWMTRLPGSGNEAYFDGEELADGKFLVSVNTEYESYNRRGHVFVLDAMGAVEWHMGLPFSRSLTTVRFGADGEFYCGFSGRDPSGPAVARADSSFNLIWTKGTGQECYALDVDHDRGTVVSLTGGSSPFIMDEIRPDGSSVWSMNYNISATVTDPHPLLRALADGTYIIGSAVNRLSASRIYLTQIDAAGSMMRANYLVGPLSFASSVRLGSLIPAPDGGYYLVGSVKFSGANQKILLAKLTDYF